MLKVHISPDYLDKKDTGDGGIRRVSEAMIKHLPAFEVEHVRDPKRADVIVNHGSMLTYAAGKPIVNVNHGLYWSRQPWGENFQDVNRLVTESMARAVAHTAPSEWVANAIRRGGLWYPEVVYHGVDAGDFSVPGEHGNYVLWNKARADHVSNPQDMQTLAGMMNKTKFISTIGRAGENVRIAGTIPYDEMKGLIAHAGVYLATARETFGIGTLEAMACGVPVAGWDWGGQSEIIVNGETGYLAPPGDFRTLAACVDRCFIERARLSANARGDVETRWRWEPRIEQYADIFKRVHDGWNVQRPAVTVIVTTYRLDRYLKQCLDSVLAQSFTDWECLVIDDANSHETWKIVEQYENKDTRIKYLATPQNMGLSGARNFGFSYAMGKFIRHLDADDWLAENSLRIEADALESEPGIHIAYGHLEVVNEDGSQIHDSHGDVPRSGWPPDQFDWLGQMAHLNQLPSCVMARREVFERSGGYRERQVRNEDAEFWCRVTSLGFRARKVTQAITYYHRQREDSKGATEWKKEGKEPDWTAWFPWRVGAGDYQEAVQILRKHGGNHPKPHLVPFGAQGQAPRRLFWYVHDNAYPVVSIVVTVGPGHEKVVVDALDSILAQSYPDWECVVVNDAGSKFQVSSVRGEQVAGFPWARVVNTGGGKGASAARNAGYAYTRGQYVIWMDADDIWLPWFLEVMVAHAERNDGVVFSDCILEKKESPPASSAAGTPPLSAKKREVHKFENYVCDGLAANMKYAGTSVLVPRWAVEKVWELQGGWDVSIPGKEDHDWQIALAHLGVCAYRVPQALFVYRMWTTTKRELDFGKIDSISEYLNTKWRSYRLEGKAFMCGCGGTQQTASQPASLLSGSGNFDMRDLLKEDRQPTDMVQLEYVGSRAETFSLKSRVMPSKMYRFGNNPGHKEKTVFLADAQFFLTLLEGERPTFRIIQQGATMENRDPASVGLGVG